MTPQADIAPGSVIDGIRIDSVAGRGGSSVVYRGTDLHSGRTVAVKVLASGDPASRRRLSREASLLARVHHPSIVPFRGLRQSDSGGMLVTDWVEGESLRELVARLGPMQPADALNILRALAEPLDHLHHLDVVHRDMSPANVIVRPGGSLTIIDLGIGHEVDSATMTADDMLAGVPKYLAPELIRGEPATGRSDQYSVGVIIHELITGQSPFPAADQVATALHHQLYSTPTPLDEVNPAVQPSLATAVLRSLDKEPERRFASMADFAQAASGVRFESQDRRRWGSGLLLGAALGLALAVGAVSLVDRAPSPGTSAGPAQSLTDSSAEATTLVVRTSTSTSTTPTSPTSVPTTAPTGASSTEPSTETSTEPSVDAEDAAAGWQDGTATGLSCNLLRGVGFTNGRIPDDYFGSPAGRERVVADRGFQQSLALEVGLAGAFGQYGEIVPIEAGETYLFSGWFDYLGDINEASMGVTFLNGAYQALDGGTGQPIPGAVAGFSTVNGATAPVDARFAVPYIFKDNSQGVLMADELIFGPSDECDPQIAAVGS